MTTAVLSIGANLGDRLATLQAATRRFAPWLVAASGVFETPPWGPVAQPNYLNAVLVVDDVAASPQDWLTRSHDAEQAAGRTRDVRWGPRTLDVDVVTVDDLVSDDPVLTLPHPRAAERAFVLVPWCDAVPGATLAGRPVHELLDALPEADRIAVRRVAGDLR